MSLHNIKTTELDGFHVSTQLFPYRMETRIFPMTGNRVPLSIVKDLRNIGSAGTFRDKVFVTCEAVWDNEEDDFSSTEFSGAYVETYAFNDAQEVHTLTVEAVKSFLDTHTMITTYVPK